MVYHGANDTGNECITSVNDTGEACITGIKDTDEVVDRYWPVSTTSVRHNPTGVNDTGNACIASASFEPFTGRQSL
jgi:hypothetical protein